ncbi:hypothetical protein F8388_015624 [Cannabis sativa]|uniref:Transcription factor MYC/MYB N-terminal domain-containing protein n=1 Tax=Cannabis sativa TaxID=3483 RepID=A0A7J6HJ46_CANSA|nr:hypothetical protein F8388_015624 [Cannabis sativa]KAF4402959.1 hypothetical protein G4B88_010411 [Cannabis sativa]
MQTVLLVPVPDGVLQLGSLETVAEDMAAVGLIRDRYDAFHTMMDERSSRGVEQRWAIVVSLISTDRIPGRAIIISVIDNLLKGALGQAMQNLNLMLGLPESTGLLSPALATSYMVGYGNNYPRQVHHKDSSIVSYKVNPKFVACREGYATWFCRKDLAAPANAHFRLI